MHRAIIFIQMTESQKIKVPSGIKVHVERFKLYLGCTFNEVLRKEAHYKQTKQENYCMFEIDGAGFI
jgi:hypothetical protein